MPRKLLPPLLHRIISDTIECHQTSIPLNKQFYSFHHANCTATQLFWSTHASIEDPHQERWRFVDFLSHNSTTWCIELKITNSFIDISSERYHFVVVMAQNPKFEGGSCFVKGSAQTFANGTFHCPDSWQVEDALIRRLDRLYIKSRRKMPLGKADVMVPMAQLLDLRVFARHIWSVGGAKKTYCDGSWGGV